MLKAFYGIATEMSVRWNTQEYYLFFKGVEAERCASFSAALKAGKPTYTTAKASLADGSIMPATNLFYFTYATCPEKCATIFSIPTLPFLVEFYDVYTIGNMNEYFTTTYDVLT